MGLSLDRARDTLTALASRPADAAELSSHLASALRTALPFDGWCLFGLDPMTGLRTVQFGQNGVEATAEMARNEAVMRDVNSYRDLALARCPAGWLSSAHPEARSSFCRRPWKSAHRRSRNCPLVAMKTARWWP